MEAAVALYTNNSLQTIADILSLNPIKVRKLLITAGVYESEIADAVNASFEGKQGIPYKKGVYFREDCDRDQISVMAEGLRRMRQRKKAVEALQSSHDEQHLWKCVVAFQGYGSRRYPDYRFPIRSRPGGMEN